MSHAEPDLRCATDRCPACRPRNRGRICALLIAMTTLTGSSHRTASQPNLTRRRLHGPTAGVLEARIRCAHGERDLQRGPGHGSGVLPLAPTYAPRCAPRSGVGRRAPGPGSTGSSARPTARSGWPWKVGTSTSPSSTARRSRPAGWDLSRQYKYEIDRLPADRRAGGAQAGRPWLSTMVAGRRRDRAADRPDRRRGHGRGPVFSRALARFPSCADRP